MKEPKELTKAESQVMGVLWQLRKGSIKDIVDSMPEPKPAYNTVATVLKVLKTKGFVNYGTEGAMYVYYPLVDEKSYARFAFNKVFQNFFNGSYKQLVSFLVNEHDIDKQTLGALQEAADKLKE